jgi:hypothetical protein
MTANKMIDLEFLTKGEVTNLAGHDRGLSARGYYGLDELDQANDTVKVVVPEYLIAISNSFFQGMFSESVQAATNVNDFFSKYQFDAPSHISARLIFYANQIRNR